MIKIMLFINCPMFFLLGRIELNLDLKIQVLHVEVMRISVERILPNFQVFAQLFSWLLKLLDFRRFKCTACGQIVFFLSCCNERNSSTLLLFWI